ncbi:MAG: pyridoxal-phosphate dependent enzyme [Sphaerochaetaceae bacterium]
MNTNLPNIKDVYEAAGRIYSIVYKTPVVEAPQLAKISGAAFVGLKLELLQPTGSFKVRGATNTILSLSQEEKKRGVITFSTGNHGKAVSYVANKVKIPSYVCLSNRVPKYRVEAIKELGGTPVIYGKSQDEAEDYYLRLKEEHGYVAVVPFDDKRVVSGQGTIALEIMEQVKEVDTLLVPLSGGGLLGGIAMTVKAIKPSIKVVGVSIVRSPAMLESLKIGKPADIEEQDSLADSLLGGIGRINNYTMELIKENVDEHILVDEQEIEEGMRYLFYNHGLVAEGAASVSVAALLSGKIDVRGKSVVMPLTGRNVDREIYFSVVQKGEK